MAEIKLNSAAIAAIDSLSAKDKRAVERSLEKLSNNDIKSLLLTPNVHKLIGEKKYYSFRASLDLRIIFEIEERNKVVILDVVRHSTIKGIIKGEGNHNESL